MSSDNEFIPPQPKKIPATPYQHQNGFNLLGLCLAFVFAFVGGVLVGWLGALIGRWIYIIVLFPFVMGFLVGLASTYGAERGKNRSLRLGFLCGAFGGVVTIISAHYFEFWFALGDLNDRFPGVVELRTSPTAFLTYIDECAKNGVRLKSSRREEATNLGYWGSYIYWGLESLAVMGISGGCTFAAAMTPFCSRCNNWKKERAFGRLNIPREVILEVLQSGELDRLGGDPNSPSPEFFDVTAFVCPHCQEKSTIDVSFRRFVAYYKSRDENEQTIRVTYPGEALAPLVNLTATKPQEVDLTGKPVPTADDLKWQEISKKKGIFITPVNQRFEEEKWKMVFEDHFAVLFDFEYQVVAVIPYSEVAERMIFPSFWESVKHLGIKTDTRGTVRFVNDKEKIAKIREKFGK